MAQDAPEIAPEVTYSPGSVTRENSGHVEGNVEFPAEGLRQMRGWSIVGIPVEMDDPRLSGQLTFVANGAGQDFHDGSANIETKTFRLENDEGLWTGPGNSVFAVGNDELLIELDTAILAGEGGYDGLTAFLFSRVGEDSRVFEAVVVETEAPPVPDPVPATILTSNDELPAWEFLRDVLSDCAAGEAES